MSKSVINGLVSATYVRDLDRSLAFYQALGFTERSAGSNDLAAWSSLHHGEHSVLLVTMSPALEIPPLPLLFYFYVADLGSTVAGLEAGGAHVEHVGYPPHAPGGEAKTTDPDGNTVLLGQRASAAGQAPPTDDPAARFSLLREAAALARRLADPAAACEVGEHGGAACPRKAEVKLADTWGDTAWACLPHADQVLLNARGAFIASKDDQGLGSFLAIRHPDSAS